MDEIYIKGIAEKVGAKVWQVENCISMFEEGDTIPFISRYRKERTGGLDDSAVAEIKHWNDVYAELARRKEYILSTIEAQGGLTDELRRRIEGSLSAQEVEDLFLPYRPKRRTRATIAREKGLEPLADAMLSCRVASPSRAAEAYVGDKVADVGEALSGARDIIAERFSDDAAVRGRLRPVFRSRRLVSTVTKAGRESQEASKYRSYFNFSIPISRVPSHNLLAMLRAEGEGYLSLKMDVDPQRCSDSIWRDFSRGKSPSGELAGQIREAIDDSYQRLLCPSLTNEVIREAKEKADLESIEVFGDNLRQLLLSPPVGRKRTLAIDPGFRNGCKTVCLDEQGNLLYHCIIYPHPPKNEKVKAITAVMDMVEKYKIEVIAIGNGTAARETEDFIARVGLPESVRVFTVSEDGASIYSASEAAREEFPDEDVTVRGAVSIGRRLMDPLSELVKIDPKSLGVGQYQHDVDQGLLKEKLDNTVVSCVNSVGVDLNTASTWLLSYVSGIGPALSSNIVAYRNSIGGFSSREQLKKVPRLGGKTFEQCAGFLRIPGAANPLDNSAVHPESYHIVDRMASDLGVSTSELVGNKALCSKIVPSDYVGDQAGLPTINDIIAELQKPGRDPRSEASEFSFAADVRSLEDLKAGMELPGIVTNITNFGAFVDIGIHENGLIHVSNMGRATLKLHQRVLVKVLDVDLERRRIGLKLIK